MNGKLWDDLKPRRVVALDVLGRNVTVLDEERGVIELELYVNANGMLQARKPEPKPIDQLGGKKPQTLAEKWSASGIDQ